MMLWMHFSPHVRTSTHTTATKQINSFHLRSKRTGGDVSSITHSHHWVSATHHQEEEVEQRYILADESGRGSALSAFSPTFIIFVMLY